jgi:hypothetical protein
MSRVYLLFMLIAFIFGSLSAQDINGKWKGEMQSPNGPMELIFTFQVKGDSLSGNVVSQMGELPIINGKVNGKSFSFDVNLGEMSISHMCTFMKDSISMKIPGMQDETMEMFLRPVPAQK